MTYGDIIMPKDGSKTKYDGFEVLSADVSTCLLARMWGADKIIWVIDKDGVLDTNGKTIRKISGNNYRTRFGLNKTDVTGGLEEKIKQSQKSGIMAHIINGLVPGNVRKSLYGYEDSGTIVIP